MKILVAYLEHPERDIISQPVKVVKSVDEFVKFRDKYILPTGVYMKYKELELE